MVNARQKGKQFELKICEKLTKITGKEWKPTPGSGAYATRTGDTRFAGDVYCPRSKSEYVWECKKYKEVDITELLKGTGNVTKWMKQLEKEKGKKKGVLVFSKNYGKIFAFIETEINLPNTFRYGKYLFGLFDEIIPKILKEK